MSNNTARRSSRLANKNENTPYSSILKKPALSKAEHNASYYADYNNEVDKIAKQRNAQLPASQKSATPEEIKLRILQQYNISPSSSAPSSNVSKPPTAPPQDAPIVPPTAPILDASPLVPPTMINNNASVPLAPTNNNASVPPLDKGKQVAQAPPTFQVPLITKFVAAAPVSYIQGRSANAKIRTTECIMARIQGFLGAAIWQVHQEKFIVAFFDSLDQLQLALN